MSWNYTGLGGVKVVHNSPLKGKRDFSPELIQADLTYARLLSQSGRETAVLGIFSVNIN